MHCTLQFAFPAYESFILISGLMSGVKTRADVGADELFGFETDPSSRLSSQEGPSADVQNHPLVATAIEGAQA